MQRDPVVCDPSVASCAAGTVGPDGTPNAGADQTATRIDQSQTDQRSPAGQPDNTSADFAAGYEDGFGSQGSNAGNRSDQALTDYNAGYAKGLFDANPGQRSLPAPAAIATDQTPPTDSGNRGPSPALEGASGLAYGTVQALTPGGFMAPSPAPQSRRFEYFRAAGQTATGIAEIALGTSGEALGTALDVTGIGALAGVPLNVASAALIAHGAVNTIAGGAGLAHAMSMSDEDGSGSGGSGSGGSRDLTDDEKWEQAQKARQEQESAPPSGGEIIERYPTKEAAIGQVEGEARVIDVVRTENAGLRAQGFTETWYLEDSNGTQWTVARNPRTGEFTGAHHSSSN